MPAPLSLRIKKQTMAKRARGLSQQIAAAAMVEPVHQCEMNDEKLALKLRKLLAGLDLNHPEPQEAIGWLLNQHNLIEQLGAIKNGDNQNVLLIARSLRHMVAHGSFTTHGP